jgi:hypothetical protein
LVPAVLVVVTVLHLQLLEGSLALRAVQEEVEELDLRVLLLLVVVVAVAVAMVL